MNTQTTNKIQTVKLRNGRNAYAVETKFGLQAKSYTNFKQADIQAMILFANGIDCYVSQTTTVKYIIIN
jgi:cell division protein FtsN